MIGLWLKIRINFSVFQHQELITLNKIIQKLVGNVHGIFGDTCKPLQAIYKQTFEHAKLSLQVAQCIWNMIVL